MKSLLKFISERFRSNNNQNNELSNLTIAVWSPHSGGATTVAASLFLYLNKFAKLKTTIIDADIYKPELDSFLGVDISPPGIVGSSGGSLNYMADAIRRGQFTSSVYDELVIRHSKRGRIITGNTSLSELETLWNADKHSNFFRGTGKDCFSYYNEILSKAKETSNIVIADCSTNIVMDSTKFFLHTADFVIIVVNSLDSKLHSASILMDHSAEHFGISKSKAIVLINKFSNCCTDISKAREFLKGWNILNAVINDDKSYLSLINSGNLMLHIKKEVFDKIAEFIGIKESLERSKKKEEIN